MLKSLPHQTFHVFSVLYFVFKRSFFTLKIASERKLEGSTTSGSSSTVDLASTHLRETQLNGEDFFFSYFLLSSLFYDHLPALIGSPILTQLAIELCNQQGGMPCLWYPKAEMHPKEGRSSHPIENSVRRSFILWADGLNHVFQYQQANGDIDYKIALLFTFPKFCKWDIFDFTLEEILTLHLLTHLRELIFNSFTSFQTLVQRL